MTWVTFAWPVAVAVGVIAALGLPSACALGLRGFARLFVAIPAGFAVLGVASVATPRLGIDWNFISPLAVAAALAAALFSGRRLLAPSPPAQHTRALIVPLASAAIGGGAIAFALFLSLKTSDAISQTYDASFHLGAVRQILDTGSASPFDMDLSAPGQSVYYPTLWHALVALVVQLSGATIPTATNAVLFVVAAVVWPIGAVALGRAVAGPSARATVVAGILSAAFPSFPLILTGYGVLYPNLLATALIPFVLVGFLQLMGLGQARCSDPLALGVRWLLLGGSLGAAVLAHPNALHVTLLWVTVPLLWALIRYARGRRSPHEFSSSSSLQGVTSLRFTVSALGIAGLVMVIGAAWFIGRTGDNDWEGHRGPLGALIDLLGSTPRLEGHAWPLTALIALGVLLVWRRPDMRWLLGSAAVLGVFFIVANGFPTSAWRTALLSPWYNDPWRLATLVSLGGFPLAVIGASALTAMCIVGFRHAAYRFGTSPRRTLTQLTAVGALFLLAATQGAGAHAGIQYVSDKYRFDESSPLLSPDERVLIERLPEHVPADAVIVNNPWNGGALAYALTGIQVMTPHTGGNYDPRIIDMTAWLDYGLLASCNAAHELDAQFVLDFGTRYVFKDTPRAIPYLGISGIDAEATDIFTEVDREGDAVLYEITGC